jgi:hypothetical protein
MPMRFDEPFWIGDRHFSLDDIALIHETLRRFHRLSRQEMAATLCENLAWTSPNGQLRVEACRGLLDAIEAVQWMPVPPVRACRPAGEPDSADHAEGAASGFSTHHPRAGGGG